MISSHFSTTRCNTIGSSARVGGNTGEVNRMGNAIIPPSQVQVTNGGVATKVLREQLGAMVCDAVLTQIQRHDAAIDVQHAADVKDGVLLVTRAAARITTINEGYTVRDTSL